SVDHNPSGTRSVGLARIAAPGHAFVKLFFEPPRRGEPGDIALHVRHEHRDAEPRETFREHHERYRLAGAGGARDETVAVSISREQRDGMLSLAEEDPLVTHAGFPGPAGGGPPGP